MLTFILLIGALLFLWLLYWGLPVSIQIGQQVNGFAQSFVSYAVTDNEGVVANPTVPAAQPAVLTTHTTNTTGSLTMTNTNHGIITGQRIDIYWTGGQCYGAIVGTVSGTTVPIASVSGGSNLPASSTPVVIGIATEVGFAVTGDNVSAIVFQTPQTGYFVLNNGSADVYAVLVQGGFVSEWDNVGSSGSNPLAGLSPTVIYMSHNYVAGSVLAAQGMIASAVTH